VNYHTSKNYLTSKKYHTSKKYNTSKKYHTSKKYNTSKKYHTSKKYNISKKYHTSKKYNTSKKYHNLDAGFDDNTGNGRSLSKLHDVWVQISLLCLKGIFSRTHEYFGHIFCIIVMSMRLGFRCTTTHWYA